MGMEIQVNSLEEMCDLMCDNKIPKQKKEKEQWYYFTFGCGHKYGGHYVRRYGTYSSARQQMVDDYGVDWGFQYSEKDWKEAENDPNRYWPLETELKEDKMYEISE